MNATAADGMQQAFAAALLDPALPLPAGLRAWNGADPATRYAVYRNNVVASLSAALADGFPVLDAVLGDADFAAMARRYIADDPPRSPVLAHYGAGLADWIAGQPPAADRPWLADLARLERERVRAYHAADAPVLEAAAIQARLADPQRLPMSRPVLHPSLGVVASRHAVVSLWAAHQRDDGSPDIDMDRPEFALVLRFDGDAVVLPVAAGTAAFCAALLAGEPLASAAAIGAGSDLGASLALLIRHRAISDWQPGEEAS